MRLNRISCRLAWVLLGLLAMSQAGCGGGEASAPPNPIPTITSLSPNSATAGGPAFTVTVNGTNFVASSTVQFAGVARTTTFVSSTQVTAAIPATDIATAGAANVTVVNPAPGGGTSNTVPLGINNPVPTLTSISPLSAMAGTAAFTLTLNGSNFVSGASRVQWNGSARPTAFQNSTQLTAQIPASDIAAVGTSQVAVFNPVPGGGTSSAQVFTINPLLVKLSTDTLTNSTSQHATEVEPDTFAFGSTIVSTFQVGRIFGGASADVGFATSTDGGATWTHGLLPGLTIFFQGGASTFNAAGDPAVAYDAAHGQWLISSIAVNEDASGNPVTEQVVVSRSPDGITWGNPIAVNPVSNYDKDWIVCDNTASSPFFGHCYVQYVAPKGIMTSSTSTDGGLTWQAPLNTADIVKGGSSQPQVQSDGTVIVPMLKQLGTQLLSFTSHDGGASWSATTVISSRTDHAVAGNLRSPALPTAEIDAAGTVYVVWQDCRFRTNCSSNDLVLSTSSDGVTWTPVTRIPIDPVTSTVDHFIPGLAVDRTTSGNTAHLTLTYYYYPVSDCGTSCELFVGFVASQDAGQTWSAPVRLAGPMNLDWLAETGGTVTPGRMVADYISGSYVNGKPFAVFAVAFANSGSVFDEAMYTTPQPMIPLANAPRFSSAGELPVPNAKSDHPPRDFHSVSRPPPF